MAPPCIVVLAAGRGERFTASGGAGSKLHAPLGGSTVLQHTLDAVRATGLPWHVEDQSHPGMGDSIAAAVRATRDAPGWLILPGDLPLVRAESLRAVAQALATGGHRIVMPMHAGQRGHPVAFSAECGAALAALEGADGAAAIVREHAAAGQVMRLEIDDPGIVTDIDTLADLERVRRLLA